VGKKLRPQFNRLFGQAKAAIAAYIIILLLVLMVSGLIVALMVEEAKHLPRPSVHPYSLVIEEKPCAYS
jgi:hypothetical protein